MAEFLIRAIDNKMPDGDSRDEAGSYKRGDIVEVYENGTCTEAPSPNSNAVIIRIPDFPTTKAKILIKSDEDDQGKVTKRRRYKFPFERLSNAQKAQLIENRYLTIKSISTLFMYDKRERVSKWL